MLQKMSVGEGPVLSVEQSSFSSVGLCSELLEPESEPGSLGHMGRVHGLEKSV